MTVTAATLYEVCEKTWPPASSLRADGWTLRDGLGGGKRVSAATQASETARVDTAEMIMRAAGERPLFMIRRGEGGLDSDLAKRGYRLLDPTNMYVCPISQLMDVPIPRVTAFVIWEPLAIMKEIWSLGGIGPERVDVMTRAKQKTGILARWNEKPAGAAFAAMHNGICMVHAVEVLSHQRRQGVAGWIMRKAAFWAAEQGAHSISVLTTKANGPANALYASLGMELVGQYHYRQAED